MTISRRSVLMASAQGGALDRLFILFSHHTIGSMDNSSRKGS